EKNGNTQVDAVCDENITSFSSNDWNGFSTDDKQKILLQYRLTYLAETEVNWCPALGTVLANDEIVNGVSERGGHPVIRKKMTQWSMRISAYAERLLQGLDTIDWTESLKESQRNWIGKSVGASVNFVIPNSKFVISVFTTRPDTIFGVTFMTLAPEHELVSQITTPEQKAAVDAYIEATAKRSERERMADVKTISGVFTGAYAEHPFTKEPIPIWIGDYVLAGYGTGAVMAVPCGDERDYAFANHFKGTNGMPEIKNIFNQDISEEAFAGKEGFELVNSDFLNGLDYKSGTKKVIEALEKIGAGKAKVNYRLRDAVFSRQRYWGEPFPVYYVNGLPQMIDAKHLPIRLPEVEKYLPTEDGQPPLGNATVWAWNVETNEVVSNDKINHINVFPLELNTMPGWAGSSWYWMRYMDAQNENEFCSQEALNYWQNVDLYIGGSEHATGHLLYARFWNKFLKDRGIAPTEEPFKKLINQGMILGMSAFVLESYHDSIKIEPIYISYDLINLDNIQSNWYELQNKFYKEKGLNDESISQVKFRHIHIDVSLLKNENEIDIDKLKLWREEFKNAFFIFNDKNEFKVLREVEKMSKSKYNVVNPDDICNEYGADTLRLYEMFLGPLEQAKPWNTAGITGVYGFLKKLWRLYFDDNGFNVTNDEPTKEMYKSLHKTIKKVTEDIENFSFNTSVSQFMICVNELAQQKCHHRAILEPLAVLISPYAPHIAEELWQALGYNESIATVAFPKFEEKYLVESSKEYPVSFNGKMRYKIELPLDLTKEEIETIILNDERTQAQLQGRTPKNVIIVPGKIINLVG
ncbi:class I tRNA ligase family protein, partial [Flavobacterium sp.]|uniref:class I tRNA ligase family protein n=1 Tax=Flavobacterium sp. TaxID=239 RepID=UPI00352775E3